MFGCLLLDFNRNGNRNSGFNGFIARAIIEHTHGKAEKIKCGEQQIGQWCR